MPSHVREQLFRVEHHLERVRACEREWRGLRLPMATPAGQRYPLVYPRDVAVIARAYDRLATLRAVDPADARGSLHGAAAFLVRVQAADGSWAQRYDLDGHERSIYPQEDNTAHAVAVLARHVRFERRAGRESPLERQALRAMRAGLVAALDGLRDEALGLVWSTTSIHESALERGYTLWTNGAYLSALDLAAEAFEAAGHEDEAARWREEHARLGDAVARHLVAGGRFVRRLDAEREPDLRPDITLLSPSYFGFESLDPVAEARAAAFAEAKLRDDELGLLARYPPDHEDMGTHLHGGHGPYLTFSSWLAQRDAEHDAPDRAREVLERIAACADKEGNLPEHAATLRRFDEFLETEWLTGLDLRKEFDPQILLPGVGRRAMLEEAARMTAAYASAARAAEEAGDGIIRLALPHAWAHAEFALALALVQRREEGRAQAPGSTTRTRPESLS